MLLEKKSEEKNHSREPPTASTEEGRGLPEIPCHTPTFELPSRTLITSAWSPSMTSFRLALRTLRLLRSASSLSTASAHPLPRRLCRPICRLSLPVMMGDARGLPAPAPDISPMMDPVGALHTLAASPDRPTVDPWRERRSPASERLPRLESRLPLRTESGSDSRDPPKTDDGAKARTEASVSNERLRRLDDDASVMMEALSVQTPWAVAALYETGWRKPSTAGPGWMSWWVSNGAEYICGGPFGLWWCEG